MKRFLILMIILCSVLILTNCGGGGGGGGGDDRDDNISKLSSMNITDAKSVYIKEVGSSASNSSGLGSPSKNSDNGRSTNRLFKIKDGNIIEEVAFYDKAGNKLKLTQNGEELCPTFLEKVNDDYIAVGFSSLFSVQNKIPNPFYLTILARKSDGAIFKIKNTPDYIVEPNNMNLGYNFRLFKSDNNGNIYYKNRQTEEYESNSNKLSYSCRAGVTKMSVAGSGISSKVITPSAVTYVHDLEVDDFGNVFFSGDTEFSGNIDVLRIIDPQGNLHDLPENVYTIWKEQDGKFHYINGMQVKMINPTTYQSELYGVATEDLSWASVFFKLQGCTYTFDHNTVAEVYNNANTPVVYHLTPEIAMDDIYGVASTDNYFFIACKGGSSYYLLRFGPGSASYDIILSGYHIIAFTVSESEGITFSAIENSTLKKIVGKVSINGTGFTRLSEENDNSQITFLERLN